MKHPSTLPLFLTLVVSLALFPPLPAGAEDDAPRVGAISPGGVEVAARIFGRCPTFTWSMVEGARAYELLIYEIGAEAEDRELELVEPPLTVAVDGNASSWMASGDLCLATGGRYAWTVRGVVAEGPTPWARPLLFSVEADFGPQAELQRAVEEYLEQRVAAGAAVTEAPLRPRPSATPEGSRESRGAAADSTSATATKAHSSAAFSVDGTGTVVARALVLDCDTPAAYYVDGDGDGFGLTSTFAHSCAPLTGYVAVAGDCDDSDPGIHPDATEVCDEVDNDCDDLVDEGFQTIWYRDADGDGWGADGNTQTGCSQPAGYVGQSGDCHDSNDAIHPGAIEICNGVDEDCDNEIDEGANCDDGITCTFDSCFAGSCQHTADDSLCNDGNACTLDSCDPVLGCQFQGCAPGTSCCGGACIDTTEDELNCGACDNVCLEGEQCLDSTCTVI